MFLHQSVRLACDINRAMAYFLREALVCKWLLEPEIVNKVQGQYNFQIRLKDEGVSQFEGTIINKEFEKRLVIKQNKPSPNMAGIADQGIMLDINFMMSASRTEFCTDVHLVQHGFDESDQGLVVRDKYVAFWQERLEALRQDVNGDWVIQDKELSYSTLMGSRL